MYWVSGTGPQSSRTRRNSFRLPGRKQITFLRKTQKKTSGRVSYVSCFDCFVAVALAWLTRRTTTGPRDHSKHQPPPQVQKLPSEMVETLENGGTLIEKKRGLRLEKVRRFGSFWCSFLWILMLCFVCFLLLLLYLESCFWPLAVVSSPWFKL